MPSLLILTGFGYFYLPPHSFKLSLDLLRKMSDKHTELMHRCLADMMSLAIRSNYDKYESDFNLIMHHRIEGNVSQCYDNSMGILVESDVVKLLVQSYVPTRWHNDFAWGRQHQQICTVFSLCSRSKTAGAVIADSDLLPTLLDVLRAPNYVHPHSMTLPVFELFAAARAAVPTPTLAERLATVDALIATMRWTAPFQFAGNHSLLEFFSSWCSTLQVVCGGDDPNVLHVPFSVVSEVVLLLINIMTNNSHRSMLVSNLCICGMPLMNLLFQPQSSTISTISTITSDGNEGGNTLSPEQSAMFINYALNPIFDAIFNVIYRADNAAERAMLLLLNRAAGLGPGVVERVFTEARMDDLVNRYASPYRSPCSELYTQLITRLLQGPRVLARRVIAAAPSLLTAPVGTHGLLVQRALICAERNWLSKDGLDSGTCEREVLVDGMALIETIVDDIVRVFAPPTAPAPAQAVATSDAAP